MAANSSEKFWITKEFLENLWSDVLFLIDKQNKRRKVEYFLRNTNKKERRIYENSMIMRGTPNHFPKRSLLAINKDLKGVWMCLCFAGGQKPQRLPFGTQCLLLPSYDIVSNLKINIQSVEEEEEASSLQENEIIFGHEENDEVKILYKRERRNEADDKLQIHSIRKKKCKGDKRIPRRDLMENFQKKKWTREDFLKHPNEIELLKTRKEKGIRDCLQEMPTKDPLLFFENAFYFNEGTQYVRMVLISAWNIHVKWCSENLLQVPLHENPVLQLKDGVVMTVSNIHPKLVVDVLVVGDIEINKQSWFTVRKLARAGKEPVIAVLPPKNSNYSFR